MALGGGTFVMQNKTLPGSYINVVSKNVEKNDVDNGVASIALVLSWGIDEKVFEVTADDFSKKSLQIFGYPADSDELVQVREIFKHANKVYFYKLNSNGAKSVCKYATAICKGMRGNDLKITIEKNVNDTSKYDVKLYLEQELVDLQTVASSNELIDNDFVVYEKDVPLTVGTTQFDGGTGTSADNPQVSDHKKYLDAMESYKFNTMGVVSEDESIKKMYVEYTKRMRDEYGNKFQCVVYNYVADYEGIINVKNSKDLVPWLIGAESACELNSSCTNMEYDGELEIEVSFTQTELENSLKSGELVFHRVGNSIRILEDINSLTTFTEKKLEDFKMNQTMRIVDKIANDIATIFNDKYLGKIPNNESSRISLWNDIVKHHQELESLGAIEDFDSTNVVVEKGETKNSVVVSDVINISSSMTHLYMTVIVQ